MKVVLSQPDTEQKIEYFIDQDRVFDFIHQSIMEKLDNPVKLPGGPTIDLSKKSLLSTALRQVFAMMVLPILYWVAEKNHVPIPIKEKHGNVIEYGVNLYVSIGRKSLRDCQLILTDENYIDDMRTITHVDIEKEDSSNPLAFLMAGKDLPDGEDSFS